MKKRVQSYGPRTDKSMQTWMQLFRAFYKINAKELKYLSDNSLTMNQFKVLEVLYHRGNLNIGSITKLTMSTPGNITVVIKNLKRDGWIHQISKDIDKRVTLLSISQKGKDLMQKVFPQHAENLRESFEVLSDEELVLLYDILRKLQKSQ